MINKLVGLSSILALGFLTWWLVVRGTRGAEIAGDIAATATIVAAASGLWPWQATGRRLAALHRRYLGHDHEAEVAKQHRLVTSSLRLVDHV